MKKLQIGYDQQAKERNDAILALREDILKQVGTFFESHKLPLKHSRIESGEFVNYFKSLFSETYLSSLPESINLAQRIKLIGIDITPLEKLQEQFNRHTPLPPNTDFAIYATTKREIEKYNLCLNLKTAFEDFVKGNPRKVNSSYSRHVSDATRDALLYKCNKLEINIRGYVLNEAQ